MPSASPQPQKSRQQLENELLKVVEEARKDLQQSTGSAKTTARIKYEKALRRFNELVLHDKIPKAAQ
jgi:hypothetical protein